MKHKLKCKKYFMFSYQDRLMPHLAVLLDGCSFGSVNLVAVQLFSGEAIDNIMLRLWKFSDFCSRHNVGVAGDDIMFHIQVVNVLHASCEPVRISSKKKPRGQLVRSPAMWLWHYLYINLRAFNTGHTYLYSVRQIHISTWFYKWHKCERYAFACW